MNKLILYYLNWLLTEQITCWIEDVQRCIIFQKSGFEIRINNKKKVEGRTLSTPLL